MNNILSFNEYNGQELEVIAYENVLNEKNGISGGVKGFFNKLTIGKVRSELSDEIEMSKTIMEGIKEGIDSLQENFDAIQKGIEDTDNEKLKGKKQETLEAIMKIIENSRKNTWDLNELIDEGEIDYTGFTANIGIASIAYFGILLTPFRATIMMHKGYNYFFNLIKNTIRKALVMLQLNFDQFENLIITKGFQSADYLQASDSSSDISTFYGNITGQLFGDSGKANKVIGKKKSEQIKQLLSAAKQQFDQQMKADKQMQQSENAYNCLDQYNNTYTRSLETLRQYSSEDVQKQLDAIKNSMNKLAGQETDLQIYAELIIAAAEEHAYAVSSSIYNKFAKMTEVFSLPNQKKMIDLIMAANKEQQKEAKRIRKEKKESKELQEKIESKTKDAEEGLKVFKSLGGVEIEELEGGEVTEDAEVKKYDSSKIKAKNWTYDEFKKKNDEERESLEIWLQAHPEVLKECDETLQVYIGTPFNNAYIDALVDYIAPCLLPSEVNETKVFTFDEYLLESKKDKKHKKYKLSGGSISSKESEPLETEYELSETEKSELDGKIDDVKTKLTDLMTLAFGSDYKTKEDFSSEEKAKLNYIIQKAKDEKVDDGIIDGLEEFKDAIKSKHKNFINFDNIDNAQINDLKELFDNEEVAVVAFKAIGDKVLKDKTFSKNSKYIVGKIKRCITEKKVGVSLMVYIMLANSIKELKDLRSHDYVTVDESSDNKKSEE